MPPPHRDRTAADSPSAEPAEYCQKCNTSYSTWKEYHIHLIQSRNHCACAACGTDFHSPETLKRHHDQMHPTEQNLNCPGCMKPFTRLGGLISHLEFLDCPAVKPDLFAARKAAVTLKSGQFEAIRAATAWGAPGVTGNEELQPLIDISTPVGSVSRAHGAFEPVAAASAVAMSETSEDLLGLTLNSLWDDEIPFETPVISKSRFPMLAPSSMSKQQIKDSTTQASVSAVIPRAQPLTPSQSYVPGLARPTETLRLKNAQQPTSSPVLTNTVPVKSDDQVSTANQWLKASTTQPNVWTTKKNLFPIGPPAIAPPTGVMEKLTIAADNEQSIEKPHDPNAPGYDPTKYWNAFTQSYKCPHAGCNKSLRTATGFAQHLLSYAHTSTERLKCPHCLRQFSSATALTQHSESQGVNCKIRNVGAYQYHVEEMTGEFATTDGWHDDNTVRYAVKPLNQAAAMSRTQGVIEANRRAEEAKKADKENYWKKNEFSKW